MTPKALGDKCDNLVVQITNQLYYIVYEIALHVAIYNTHWGY